MVRPIIWLVARFVKAIWGSSTKSCFKLGKYHRHLLPYEQIFQPARATLKLFYQLSLWQLSAHQTKSVVVASTKPSEFVLWRNFSRDGLSGCCTIKSFSSTSTVPAPYANGQEFPRGKGPHNQQTNTKDLDPSLHPSKAICSLSLERWISSVCIHPFRLDRKHPSTHGHSSP